MRTDLLALALGLASLAACQATNGAPSPGLLTSADLELLLGSAGPDTMVAAGAGLPGGIPLRRIMSFDANHTPTLVPRATVTDTYRSAYLTTEVWTHFDAVWVQPMYLPVDHYADDGTPVPKTSASGQTWHPIFGVGSASKFYSPYWQATYFEIPDGLTAASFQSARDVIDHGLDLKPAEGRLAVIVPDSLALPMRVTTTTDGSLPVGGPTIETGIVDGQPATYLDFGTGTFTWDANLIVEEAPIFMWVARDKSGDPQTLDIPSVAGAGPLYSGRSPATANGKPLYGSYWRLYTVEVPAGAGVFAPPEATDLRAGLAARTDLYAGPYDASGTVSAKAIAPWLGRVAMNPTCFADYKNIDPDGSTGAGTNPCQYIDSQGSIEAIIPSDVINRTEILVTCPFITYDEKALLLP